MATVTTTTRIAPMALLLDIVRDGELDPIAETVDDYSAIDTQLHDIGADRWEPRDDCAWID